MKCLIKTLQSTICVGLMVTSSLASAEGVKSQTNLVGGSSEQPLHLQKGFDLIESWPQQIAEYNTSPTILNCREGLLCVVRLQPGEIISDVTKQNENWRYNYVFSETAANVSFWALDKGELGSASITTNKRHYYIYLVPHPSKHTPLLSYTYPETDE